MTSATKTTAPTLWRNRDFVTLWSGQVVSALGARISAIAMPLLVLAQTGSPADAGLVAAAGTLPFLIAHLPAGSLARSSDGTIRWTVGRRSTMLVRCLSHCPAVWSCAPLSPPILTRSRPCSRSAAMPPTRSTTD